MLAILMIAPAWDNSYADYYKKEYNSALTFFGANREGFEAMAERTGAGAGFLFSIVAPEISRYDNIADKVQTMALNTLYVQFGKEYADFSIGYFQMKPSFAEQVEDYIQGVDILLEAFPEIPIDGMTVKEARSERIHRLEDIRWQFLYLAAFYSAVRHRFGGTAFPSEEKRLWFYANAYNSGFLNDVQYLIKEQRPSFPRTGTRRFRYADVALCFFLAVH